MDEYADIIQIGTRNMANFCLLKRIGQVTADSRKPVVFKRGMAATIEEWLQASDYITMLGNENVILCERGIRTFETATRFTLDITAVPVVKKLSLLPIIVDVSHPTGPRRPGARDLARGGGGGRRRHHGRGCIRTRAKRSATARSPWIWISSPRSWRISSPSPRRSGETSRDAHPPAGP